MLKKIKKSKTIIMSSSSIWISILAMVAMLLPFIDTVLSLNQTNAYLQHICINGEGKYKPGGPYDESRLKLILEGESYLRMPHGFFYIDSGFRDTDDKFYAKVQCRGDFTNIKCRSCILTAYSAILRICPNNKGRMIWYDECFLYISSVDTWRKLDNKNTVYLSNTKDVRGNKESFNKKTRALLRKLKEKASHRDQNIFSNRGYLYETGEASLGITKKLYGMVQCTRDLSAKKCGVCLDGIIAKLPSCCNGKQGGRVLNPGCNIRYELYPFVEKIKED